MRAPHLWFTFTYALEDSPLHLVPSKERDSQRLGTGKGEKTGLASIQWIQARLHLRKREERDASRVPRVLEYDDRGSEATSGGRQKREAVNLLPADEKKKKRESGGYYQLAETKGYPQIHVSVTVGPCGKSDVSSATEGKKKEKRRYR